MIDIKLLGKIGKIKKFERGKYIYIQGAQGNELYIVLSGKVDVYINDDDKQTKIEEINEGDFFGEMSVIDNKPRTASVICSEDTIVCSINNENFMELISKQPMIAVKIIKRLSSKVEQQNSLINSLKKKHKSKSYSNNLKSLLPKNHKVYDIVEQNNNEDLLYSKKLLCPICKSDFKDLSPRMSKIKLLSVEPDFRKKYEGIEPIWYSISICPECNYSGFQNTFPSLNTNSDVSSEVSLSKKQLSTIPYVKYSVPRNIEEVFSAHYTALKCLELADEDKTKYSKVWLQLSWLYDDVEDKDMYNYSINKAYKAYYMSYYGSHTIYEEKEEQQLCMILAELLLKQDNIKDAYLHYQKALNLNKDNQAVIKQIRERINYIRSKQR